MKLKASIFMIIKVLFLFLSNKRFAYVPSQFAFRSRVGAAENSLLGSSDLSTIIGPAKGGGFGQVWSLLTSTINL